jgi:hypothetical protein
MAPETMKSPDIAVVVNAIQSGLQIRPADSLN